VEPKHLEKSFEIVFVLVEPARPENIGATARAIKTMGFSHLRLVNTDRHHARETQWVAHGAKDILQTAELHPNLESALEDIDFSIGTTAKRRSVKVDYYTPEEARKILLKKSDACWRAALVFGREESGLTNDELRLCDLASSIPLEQPYPSINLAQSVMIYVYAFSSISQAPDRIGPNADELMRERVHKELKAAAVKTLSMLETVRSTSLHYRMLERLATCSTDDARLMLSVAKRLNEQLERKMG
jgi:tRNA/rRNA methyltransferase